MDIEEAVMQMDLVKNNFIILPILKPIALMSSTGERTATTALFSLRNKSTHSINNRAGMQWMVLGKAAPGAEPALNGLHT